MRLFIIDGYNLIHIDRELSECFDYNGMRAARDEAERVVLRWARIDAGVEVLILYDGKHFPGGHPGNRDDGPLRVRFVDPPAEADDLIRYDAREAVEKGKRVVVVTDDRKVSSGSVKLGADHISIQSFVSLLELPPREPFKESRFSNREIEETMREQLDRSVLDEEPSLPSVSITQTPRVSLPGKPTERAEQPIRPARNKSKQEERYNKRMKKRAAPGKGKPPKRKKKRGY